MRLNRGLSIPDAEELIEEMAHSNVIVGRDSVPEVPQPLPEDFPIQTLVLNLTNQCNLSCQYCYEFGEDKVATPEGKKKFMDFETAKPSVAILCWSSRPGAAVHSHHLLRRRNADEFPAVETSGDVREPPGRRARPSHRFQLDHQRHAVDAHALSRFLSDNSIGVTVSMDGPTEMHDNLRVFSNGKGSYDIIEPRVRALIQNHRTRPITARVTLTAGVSDVIRIFRHLKQDLGFPEVGFAPVTTSPNQLYAINATGMDSILDQFHTLADEYLDSIEGKRGIPRMKPPFPAVVGAWQSPSLINNVETLSAIPAIIRDGGAAFAALGPPKNGGTRMICLSGHINKPGVYELPVGFNLLRMIYEVGGGMRNGKKLKAVVPGGSSCPLLKAEECDIAMDFDTLAKVKSMLGSGGTVILDEDTCMVRFALRIMKFYAHESCGWCIPCREGTTWLKKMLQRFHDGGGQKSDIPLIGELSKNMLGRTFCALGDAAAMPTISIVEKFPEDFEAHLNGRPCPYAHASEPVFA